MKKIFPLFAVIIVLVLAVCSFHIIPTGYTGVKTSFGQIQETTIQSGKLNFCIPFVQSQSPAVCVGHLALRLLGMTGVFGVHSFRLRLIDRIVPLVVDIIGGVGAGLGLDITVCQRGCLQVQGVCLDFLAVLIGLTLDGRTASTQLYST